MEELLEEIISGSLEITTIICFLIMGICLLISIHVTWRIPLYYNLFIVEMHTWTTRRVVQVLHLGQEYTCNISWDRLMSRMRARLPRVPGETRLAVSDTNIVIQSPNTVIDAPQPTRMIENDRITLWDIEMPPLEAGSVPNSTRDSQFAAAAAIAILARGDDHNIRSRAFTDFLRENRNSTPRRPAHEDISSAVDTRNLFEGNVSASEGGTREISTSTEDGSTSTTSYFDESSQENAEVGEKALIRLKFMSDAIRDTYALLSDTIGKYKGEHFKEAIKNNLVVRLIFQGQLLRDDNRTLDSYGVVSGSVLHCHISKVPYNRPAVPAENLETSSVENNRVSQSIPNILNSVIDRQQPEMSDEIENDDSEPLQRIIDSILLIAIPLMAALGVNLLGFNRGSTIRPSLGFFMYRWLHNFFLGDDGDNRFEIFSREQLPSTSTLFWIFGGQLVAVSIFVWFFPQVVDKTAIMLMVLLILYFIFVIWKARERIDSQNETENVQENRSTF